MYKKTNMYFFSHNWNINENGREQRQATASSTEDGSKQELDLYMVVYNKKKNSWEK